MILELYADLVEVEAVTSRTNKELVRMKFKPCGQPRLQPLFTFFAPDSDYAYELLTRGADALGIDLEGITDHEWIVNRIKASLPARKVMLPVEFPQPNDRFPHPNVRSIIALRDEDQ